MVDQIVLGFCGPVQTVLAGTAACRGTFASGLDARLIGEEAVGRPIPGILGMKIGFKISQTSSPKSPFQFTQTQRLAAVHAGRGFNAPTGGPKQVLSSPTRASGQVRTFSKQRFTSRTPKLDRSRTRTRDGFFLRCGRAFREVMYMHPRGHLSHPITDQLAQSIPLDL